MATAAIAMMNFDISVSCKYHYKPASGFSVLPGTASRYGGLGILPTQQYREFFVLHTDKLRQMLSVAENPQQSADKGT
jgi:hypothetical protein